MGGWGLTGGQKSSWTSTTMSAGLNDMFQSPRYTTPPWSGSRVCRTVETERGARNTGRPLLIDA